MTHVSITHFADPSCPWDFAAEPVRQRLLWHYGSQLEWRSRMIVLYEDVESQVRRGRSPERISAGLLWFRERFGMPMDVPLRRLAASEPACRAVVAARVHDPDRENQLLRELRIRCFAGAPLDDPETITSAAEAVGIVAASLERWLIDPAVESALREDVAAARSPATAARALDDKLGGPAHARRYTAPSYELRVDGCDPFVLPGFHGVDACEAAIANLAPNIDRRPRPQRVEELLDWARAPLATAEIALVMGLDLAEARRRLATAARPIPVGSEFYWTFS